MLKMRFSLVGIANAAMALAKIGTACYIMGSVAYNVRKMRKEQKINDKYYNGQEPIYTDFVGAKEGA